MIMLLALLILVIFGMLALSLDTTMVATSRAHFKLSAEQAAMAALERYGESLVTKSQDEALEDAVERAHEILRENFQKNPGRVLQKVLGNTQDDIGLCELGGGGMGANGCIRPVRWYFPFSDFASCDSNAVNKDPDDDEEDRWRPCPCNQACECGEGCPKDPYRTNQIANGLKLIYRTDSGSPLRGLFRRIADFSDARKNGQTAEMNFRVAARAILVPRNAVFLLDLSDSMVWEPSKFKPATTAALCPGLRYVYDIQPGATCNNQGTTVAYPPPPAAPYAYSTTLGDRIGFRQFYAHCVYKDNVAINPPGAGNLLSEYQCIDLPAVDLPGTTTISRSFLVNQVDPKPEPLTSALSAVHRAMKDFQDRKVPGDKLGIIGFDSGPPEDEILDRILAQDRDDPTKRQPSLVGTESFNDFFLATNISTPITDSVRNSKFLFPRYIDSKGKYGNVNSDLPTALFNARRMIINTGNYQAAQNFVVMFSDGMSNCLSPIDCRLEMATLPAYLGGSLNLVNDELQLYRESNITLNFFLLGANSMPHELAFKMDGANRCATQDEIRSQGLPLVNATGSFATKGTPIVNRLFAGVGKTGGLWAPIRDFYGSGSPRNCPLMDKAAMDAECAAKLDNASILSDVTSGGGGVTDGVLTGGGNPWGGSDRSSIYWDDNGRIACDPLNRNVNSQVQDYMKEILAKPPYILATPSCYYDCSGQEGTLPRCAGLGTCPAP